MVSILLLILASRDSPYPGSREAFYPQETFCSPGESTTKIISYGYEEEIKSMEMPIHG